MVPTVGEAAADFGAGQSARYNKNVNGDFLMVGNTVLNCSGSSCTTNSTTNDDLNMANNDPDGNGALFNGSSATFTIPSGAVVDRQPALDVGGEADPELARRQVAGTGQERRADWVAGHGVDQHIGA